MRFTRVIAIAATAVFAMGVAQTADAQVVVDKNRSYFSPENQFGFGVNNRGGTIQYAVSPAFHIGLNLALDFYKDSARSETYYDFGPYAKFLFSGDLIKPYGILSVGVVQPKTGSFNLNLNQTDTTTGTVTSTLPDPEIRVYLGFGGEHFLNQNVGLYGHVNLIDAMIAGGSGDETTFDAGLLGSTVGVEFFF